MKFQHVLIGVTLMSVSLTAFAGDAPTTRPAPKSSPPAPAIETPATRPAAAAPTTRPALEKGVAAMVGERKYLEKDLDAMIQYAMRRSPVHGRRKPSPERMKQIRKSVVEQWVQRALIQAHLETLPCTDAELAEFKKTYAADLKKQKIMTPVDQYLKMKGITDDVLRQQIKFQRIQKDGLSKAKAAAFVKTSPASYFDGTTVKASHILIQCKPYAPEAEKAAARAKLAAIAGEIKAGKISFADAAKKHSTGPSGPKGGELGEFPFMDPNPRAPSMATPFAVAAFALKVAEVSDVVETDFGYHLIKVTGRTEGKGKADPKAATHIAARTIGAVWYSNLFRKAAKANPVVIAQ